MNGIPDETATQDDRGSLETYTDLELKKAIDAGEMPGPKLDVTGPYLEGKGKFGLQMHDPDALIQSVSGLVFLR